MRIVLLACLLLILPWQRLGAQDAEPLEDPPVVEDALPEDPEARAEQAEPEVIPEVIPEPPADSQANAAGDDPAEADEDVADVPSRVARLSSIEGEVSIAPAGTEELAEAVLNRPLTSGDRVLVDNDARAELQTGNATIYLDGPGGLSLVELSDDALRASLTEGTAVIRIRRKQDGEIFEVATPNGIVELERPGEYSITVDPDAGRTTVRTRSGEATVASDRNSFRVKPRQQGEFTGTDKLAARFTELGERTAFEALANERERRDLESRSSSYVSRDVIGYEDLDEHGDWIEEPEYGHVWRPRHVEVGWVPYRYGRWAFIAPWGWTWIDHARWGFAPFHYGRWAYVRSRWCWVPGPRHFRPVYAPALVGWTGRSTVSVSVAFGSGIGWFPLAPREIYVPPYRYSRRYAHNLNVSNTIIINNTTFINNIYRSGGRQGWRNGRQSAFLDYRYRKQANAVTLVERDVFVGGRNIDGRFRRLDDRQWQRARHDGVPPVIDPQRSSLLAGRAIQRTGWQQRFARAERAFGPRADGNDGSAARRRADLNDGARGQRWQDRGAQLPRNGFAPGQQPREQAGLRRWQDRPQPSDAERGRARGSNGIEPRRWQDRSGDQSEPRRWQDRRGDERRERDDQSQRRWQDRAGDPQATPRRWQDGGGDQRRERRWQDRGGDQQPERRWQDRGGDQQRERRWQDRGGDQQPERRWQDRGDDPQRERRWQDRGGDQQSERRWQDRGGDQQRERRWQDRGGDQQPERRWQDRGGQRDQPREERRQEQPRWQDRGQRSQPQQQPRQEEGRRGWQQRSNDQPSRGNGNGPRWQRQ